MTLDAPTAADIAAEAPSPPAPAPPVTTSGLPLTVQAAPYRFGFHAVLRLFEARNPGSPRLGCSKHPKQDRLRLAQEPTVTHAPASLASFEPASEHRPDRLTVHVLGLFGPDGPLPLHITEQARDRQRNHGDSTLRRFIDIFHHRLLSLFHRAWADVRPTVSFDRPAEDRFAKYTGALVGLSTPGLQHRDAMPDLTKLHFAGLLGGQTRHAEGLATILTAFFVMPVQVESFIGGWLNLPPSDVTRLGSGPDTAALGRTALLGGRSWSRQHKFRLVFGPLSLVQYERLLPDGSSFQRLVPIVRNWAGDALAWDVNIVLHRDEVPRTILGSQGRLGWTSWLLPRRSRAHAADLFLEAGSGSNARAVLAKTKQPHAENGTPE